MDRKSKCLILWMVIMIALSYSATAEYSFTGIYDEITDDDSTLYVTEYTPTFLLNTTHYNIAGTMDIANNRLLADSGIVGFDLFNTTTINYSQWKRMSMTFYSDGEASGFGTIDDTLPFNTANVGIRCEINGLGVNTISCYSSGAHGNHSYAINTSTYYNLSVMYSEGTNNWSMMLRRCDSYTSCPTTYDTTINDSDIGALRGDVSTDNMRNFFIEGDWGGAIQFDQIHGELFDNGTLPIPVPVLTINAPANDTGFTTNDVYINISDTTALNLSCELVYQNNMSLIHAFEMTTNTYENFSLPEGSSDLNVTCYNGGGYDSELITYFIDTADPSIVINAPLNASISDGSVSIQCTDANLYSMEIDLYNAYYTYVLFNLTAINTTQYNYTESMPANMTDGHYNLSVRCADSHTANELKTMWEVSYDDQGLDLGAFSLSLRESSLLDSIDVYPQTDRWSYSFYLNIDTIGLREYNFDLRSPNKLHYLEDSKYPGHFVSGDFWIDFAPYKPDVVMLDDYHALVTIRTDDQTLSFDSAGELNIVNSAGYFYLNRSALEFGFENNGSLYQSDAEYSRIGINFSVENVSDPGLCYYIIDGDLHANTSYINGTNPVNITGIMNGTHSLIFNCSESIFGTDHFTLSLNYTFGVNTSYIAPSMYDNLSELLPDEIAGDIDPDTIPGIMAIGLIVIIAFAFMIAGELIKINLVTFALYIISMFAFFTAGLIVYSTISIWMGILLFFMMFPIVIRIIYLMTTGE